MFGPKYRLRHERRELLKKMFDAQVEEFFEDNNPTQIATFFEDVLRVLPNSYRTCEIEAIFKGAFEEWK